MMFGQSSRGSRGICSKRGAALASAEMDPLALLLAILFLCHVASVESTTKWHSCGSKSVPVHVEDVEMSPDPPVRGFNFTLLLPTLTRRRLVAGSVQVSITYDNVVPIWSQTEDLCDKAQCPVPPGNVTFQHIQHIPWVAPPGSYSVRLAAVDPQQSPLFCTVVNLNVVSQSQSGTAGEGRPGQRQTDRDARQAHQRHQRRRQRDHGGREAPDQRQQDGAGLIQNLWRRRLHRTQQEQSLDQAQQEQRQQERALRQVGLAQVAPEGEPLVRGGPLLRGVVDNKDTGGRGQALLRKVPA